MDLVTAVLQGFSQLQWVIGRDAFVLRGHAIKCVRVPDASLAQGFGKSSIYGLKIRRKLKIIQNQATWKLEPVGVGCTIPS